MSKCFRKWQFFFMCLAVILMTGCRNSGNRVSESLQQGNQERMLIGAEQETDRRKEDENQGQNAMNIQKEQLEQKMQANDEERISEALKEPEPEAVDISLNDFEAWNALMKENSYPRKAQQALEEFSYESASRILSREKGNGNFSPLSLYYALALAGSGAEGETSRELLTVLGAEDKEALSQACRLLYRQLYYREQRTRQSYEMYGEGEYQSAIKLRNSLWLSNAYTFHSSYQEAAAHDFYASVHPVDFYLPEAGEAMGKWISEQTNGVLAPSLSLDPNTALCILNTLYFYGGWQDEFPEEQTKPAPFMLNDGTCIECPMMNREDNFGIFRKGDGYTLSALGTNNNCRMVVLLPDRDRNVSEFVQTGEALEKSLGSVSQADEDGWQRGTVIWKLPKFSFGSSYHLGSLLQQMGIQQMFNPQTADFSGISPEKPLWVSQVIQESHIGIDESGIEGAAYTMLAVCGAGMPEQGEAVEMICDRPFIYGIQEISSGAWLFIGICQNPNAGLS